jgi:hypothetical protein
MLLVQQNHTTEMKLQMGEVGGDHWRAWVVYCDIVNGIEEGLVSFLDCSLMMVFWDLFINDGIVSLEKFNVGFQMKLFVDLCRLGVVRT